MADSTDEKRAQAIRALTFEEKSRRAFRMWRAFLKEQEKRQSQSASSEGEVIEDRNDTPAEE